MVKGTESHESPGASGVQLGSVIGPILFLVYINNLPVCVKLDVRLFANDTIYILYWQIAAAQDHITRHKDFYHLVQWTQDWGTDFHPGKGNFIAGPRLNRYNSIMMAHSFKLQARCGPLFKMVHSLVGINIGHYTKPVLGSSYMDQIICVVIHFMSLVLGTLLQINLSNYP